MQNKINFPLDKIYMIDLFCGAGGTSTAAQLSNTKVQVIACINHDAKAIESHKANHPNCLHYTEDIRTVNLMPLLEVVKAIRRNEPGSKIAIWASLECTHFSKAKSGPKNADSRTLAYDLLRYLHVFNPDFLWIENVEEFLSWGPLDSKNNPIQSKKGQTFKTWKAIVQKWYGLQHYRKDILCSADFGGYTIRKRLFLQFSKRPQQIGIPKPTTSNNWKPVKDVLDLHLKGQSIFTRKNPYCSNTHRKIFIGIQKFVNERFFMAYYGAGGYVDIKKPSWTLTTKDRFSLVSPLAIKLSNNKELCNPMNTDSLVKKCSSIYFVHNPQYGGSNRSINEPCCTVIARQDKAPLQLTSATTGKFMFNDLPSDDEWMLQIKDFCRENDIQDILVRPLNIQEMLRIQGFPRGYKLIGTKGDQKKFIGNSVEVNVGIALFKAIDQAV